VLADLESDSPTPVFTSFAPPQTKKKTSGALIALLVLVLAGGGLYAAWMYQPGFREAAQPLIDRLIGMVENLRGAPQTGSSTAASTSVPVKLAPVSSNAASTSDASATAATTISPSPAPATTDTAPSAAASAIPTPAATKPEAATESPKVDAVALPSNAELPGEKTAVILSSQGAEKRLVLHAPPLYPAEARKARIEGTVVLKALVSDAGTVEGVRLVEGNPALAAAAISAVKKWHYRAYIRDGKALPFQTIVLVEFQRP
jgi:TonB family protein